MLLRLRPETFAVQIAALAAVVAVELTSSVVRHWLDDRPVTAATATGLLLIVLRKDGVSALAASGQPPHESSNYTTLDHLLSRVPLRYDQAGTVRKRFLPARTTRHERPEPR